MPVFARLVLALSALGLLWELAPRRDPPGVARLPDGALELDPACMGVRDLRRLPGIGDGRALRVLRARRAPGPAGPPARWSDVHGIGPRTEARVRAWLAAHGGDPDAPLGVAPVSSGSGARPPARPPDDAPGAPPDPPALRAPASAAARAPPRGC